MCNKQYIHYNHICVSFFFIFLLTAKGRYLQPWTRSCQSLGSNYTKNAFAAATHGIMVVANVVLPAGGFNSALPKSFTRN